MDFYRSRNNGVGEMTPVLRLLAGAGAGIVAMSATYPLDMVRGRLTVQEGKAGQYKGIAHACRMIIKEVRVCVCGWVGGVCGWAGWVGGRVRW